MAFNIFATATSDIPLANLDANFTMIGSSAVASTLYPTATTSITYGTTGTEHIFSAGKITGPHNGTVGATTPSTGAFTTLSASSSLTMSISGAGSQGGSVANTNTAAGAWASWGISNGTRSLKLATLSTGWSGTFLTGGPTTEQSVIYTDGNIPIVFGINSSMVGQFTSTGLNSAAIGATTPSTGAFTTLSATGTITSSSSHPFTSPTSGTSYNYIDLNNTGGQLLLGLDSSGGGIFSTGTPYGGFLNSPTTFIIQVAGSTKASFSSTGLAVTGTLSATGSGTGTFPLKLTATGCDLLRVQTNTAGGGMYIQSTNSIETVYAPLGFYATSFSFNADATIYGVTVGRGGGAVSTNTAVGGSALAGSNSGGSNTAVGYQSGYSNTTGSSNTLIGLNARYYGTAGTDNVAVGTSAMQGASTTTTGSSNTAVGSNALFSNTTASGNTAVGYQALYASNRIADTNAYNLGMGYQAGFGITTGQYNTFVGGSAPGWLVTSGSKNTILGNYNGNQGGLDIRTGSNYVVLSDGDGNIVASSKTAQTFALQGGTLSTGTGIAFPATQSASTDANTLDDYEEGTWTPSLTSFTVVGSPTYTGFYTKVGRQVTVVMQLTATTIASSGSSFINNLPFSQGVTSVGSMATMTDNSGSGSASNGYISGSTYYPGTTSATQYKYLTATYFTS